MNIKSFFFFFLAGIENSTKAASKRVGGWDSTLPRDVYEDVFFLNEDPLEGFN